MLGNLKSKIELLKKNSLSLINNLPIIELNDDDQRIFEQFFKKQNLKCICNSQSFQVETSENHWAVCSNQYLALAAIGYDFAMCLKKYFDFLDNNIRRDEEETKKILDLQIEFQKNENLDIDQFLRRKKCKPYINHINDYPRDKDSLCYFLAGIGVKKFGTDKLRGTGDLFGSYVLAIYPVTTVASGFLGGLIYALVQDKDSFDKIVASCNNSKERLPKPNGEKNNIYNCPPTQIIYYGVPGCGKSNKIKQDFENGNVDEEAQVVRCVFHPEYTNADFVGQIYPVAKKDGKGVDYKFKPGPFTEILRRAYLNPLTNFFLVIEEINRGNAAAIFGEMFQLLDRIKEGKDKSGFGPGWSSYSILNDDVNDYIRNIEAFDKFEHAGCVKQNLYKDMRDGNGNAVDALDENGKKEIDFSTATSYSSLELTLQGFDVPQIFRESTSIRLPPNLSILATMNTSDQNVFTLDNAFKRRFDSELIKNTLAGDEHKVQRETKIEGTSVTWGEFWEKINNLILEKNASMTSTEDKRLGAYFIVGDEKTDAAGNKYREVSKKLFGEKVLEYLWNDAFKFKHKDIFKEDCKSVESLIENFEEGGFAAVFKNDEFTAATVQELKASDN